MKSPATRTRFASAAFSHRLHFAHDGRGGTVPPFAADPRRLPALDLRNDDLRQLESLRRRLPPAVAEEEAENVRLLAVLRDHDFAARNLRVAGRNNRIRRDENPRARLRIAAGRTRSPPEDHPLRSVSRSCSPA